MEDPLERASALFSPRAHAGLLLFSSMNSTPASLVNVIWNATMCGWDGVLLREKLLQVLSVRVEFALQA
jgi:hypothetical protein